MFLSWQAHFLHSHRRSGFIWRTALWAPRPGSENWGARHRISWLRGVRRSASPSAAPACEGVMSFLGLNASTRFMRARAPTSAISYIRHSKMKTPEGGLHAVFLFLYTKGASANFAEK